MKSKTVFPNPKTPAEVGVLVANGEAEIGVHIVQESMVAGIEIFGPLPGGLQDIVVFAAAIVAGAKNADIAKELVKFLRTPDATVVSKAKGMEPATP